MLTLLLRPPRFADVSHYFGEGAAGWAERQAAARLKGCVVESGTEKGDVVVHSQPHTHPHRRPQNNPNLRRDPRGHEVVLPLTDKSKKESRKLPSWATAVRVSCSPACNTCSTAQALSRYF